MIRRLGPPLCLVLALVLLIFAFGTIANDWPSVPLELHQARASGDIEYQETLEDQFRRTIFTRYLLIVGMFTAAGVSIVLAFVLMGLPKTRPS